MSRPSPPNDHWIKPKKGERQQGECEAMKLRYDRSADAAYIYLRNEIGQSGVAESIPFSPHMTTGEVILDFDEQGILVGIEFLDASQILPPEALTDSATK